MKKRKRVFKKRIRPLPSKYKEIMETWMPGKSSENPPYFAELSQASFSTVDELRKALNNNKKLVITISLE